MAVNLSRAKFFNAITSRISSALYFRDKSEISSHFPLYFRGFYVSSSNYMKKKDLNVKNIDLKPELLTEQENKDLLENPDYKELVHRMQLLPSSEGHQILIIQPYVKWGPKKNEITTPDLMVEEAKALIDSLPNWKCVDTIKVPLESIEKKHVFGTGVFESLQQQVVRNPNISAVFVSVNILRGIQRK